MRHGYVVSVLLFLFSPYSFGQTWNDGAPSRTQHLCNLWVGDTVVAEDLTWSWTGFQGTPGGVPKTGDIYYSRIAVAGLGCSGAWVNPEVRLPKDTALAVDSSHPIRCFFERDGVRSEITDGSCPTAASVGRFPNASGFIAFPPATQAYWPLPTGVILSIEFPTTSSSTLSGIAGNDYLLGAVDVLDNNPGGPVQQWDGVPVGYSGGLPSAGPWQGVFVTAGALGAPYLVYPEPSARNIVESGTSPGMYSADTVVHIYDYDCLQNAQVYWELFYTDDTVDNIVFEGGACTPIPGGDTGAECVASWSNIEAGKQLRWHAQLTGTPNGCGDIINDVTDRYFSTPSPLVRYRLFLDAQAGGSITASQPPTEELALYAAGTYSPGFAVTVTAVADADYDFDGWLIDGGLVLGTNPYSLTMDSDHTVVAQFKSTAGTGTGTGTNPGSGSGTNAGSGGGQKDGGCNAAQGSAWLGLAFFALLRWRQRRLSSGV